MNWPTQNDPNNPDATPAYDGWGWDDYWSASDWLAWHRAMKAAYGLEVANSRFVNAWEAGIGWFSNSVPINARTFDSSFRDYARENGFLDALYGQGLGALAQPIGAITDTGSAVGEVGAGIKTSGNVLRYVVPVVIVAALLVFVWLKLRKAQ